MFGKPTTIPSKSEALPGRAERMAVPDAHHVNGARLQDPFPPGLEKAMFGMGCFWGAERKFWQQRGVYTTAAGYAAFTLMPEGAAVLTVEFKMNLLRPARGAVALARAEVLKPGRTLMAVRADVFCRAAEAGAEELAATMLATMMCVRDRPDVPPG